MFPANKPRRHSLKRLVGQFEVGAALEGPRKKNLSKFRVILREPWRLKNPLGVREILRSLGLPQDDMHRFEFRKLFFREPVEASHGTGPVIV